MGNKPRGLFRFVEPSERRRMRREIEEILSDLMRADVERFEAFRNMRKSLRRILDGDDGAAALRVTRR